MKRDLPHPMRRDASLASCVALIDQRYLSWLLGHTPESEPINRFALHGVLTGLMEHAGVSAEVHRGFMAAPSPVSYWEDKIDEAFSSQRLR